MTLSQRSQTLSLARYSPAFLVFIIAIADAGRWADPDLWGHLAFGRLILARGHLPSVDVYSYSAGSLPGTITSGSPNSRWRTWRCATWRSR